MKEELVSSKNFVSSALPLPAFAGLVGGEGLSEAATVIGVYSDSPSPPTSHNIYDGQLRPVAELGPTGTVTATFVYGTHINIPDIIIKGTTTYRVITDHLGSLRFVINTTDGTIAQRIDYDDWGNVLVNTAPDFTPFGFAGGMYDSQTKLVRFGARDYDAETGRWTAKDVEGFAGKDTNLFAYCLLNPCNLIDPDGELVIYYDTIEQPYTGLELYEGGNTVFHYYGSVDCTCADGGFKLSFKLWVIANVQTTPGARVHEMKHVAVGMKYFGGLATDVLTPPEKKKYSDKESCEKAGEEALNDLKKRANQYNFKYRWNQCKIDLFSGDPLSCFMSLLGLN